MRVNLFLSFSIYLVLTIGASADDMADLTGTWRTVRHGALVSISDCGNATPCASLQQVSVTITNDHIKDVRNPDPDLRERTLIGLPIFWGFVHQDGRWKDGRLYSPEDGKTFRAYLQLISAGELQVTGCLGPFCRSQIWTRTN